jgi:Ala-tRNA(Pro) deacylase
MLKNRLTDVLDGKAIGYELIHHVPDYSALETAHDTHTPGAEFAKTVVVETPRGPVMAVVPAPERLDLERFGKVLGTGDLHLADEAHLARLFPDCQLGAEPPFGHLYDMPVYVDESLARGEYITFNAGSHQEALRLRFADFEGLVRPRHAAISAGRA